ncbi:MAG TPA: protein kinase [Acidobacteriota bacterium]|nr:protein kinase [Acidobacteriota bacterium]
MDAAAKLFAEDVKEVLTVNLTGRTLSHYHLLRKVGEGGMGVVYLAHDDHLQRDVAVKVLPHGRLDHQSARKRFRKEALALSKLNHPNIETVYDFDTQEGIDFLVMEHLKGETLGQKLVPGPLPAEEVARLGEQLAEGLEAAHAQGVVHCDLKPGNIMIVAGGRLKILDFGLARLLRLTSDTPSLKSLEETQGGGGTVPYMSPEQLRGGAVDVRSDLFSTGAVLYEMATGRRAFEGSTPAMVSDAILRRAPVAPTRLNPEVSTALQRIILKALEKNPRKRYQSANELLNDLRRHSSLSAPPQLEAGRREGSWIVKSVAAVLLLGAILLSFAWLRARRSDRTLPDYRPIRVTRTESWDGEPAVSPDGTMIAYTSNASGNRDIWLTDLRGTRVKRLTDDPADDSSPAWFPDQSAIAFVSERGGSKSIWRVDVTGGGARLLVPGGQCPAISQDGKYIAFSRSSPAEHLRIGIASLENPGNVRPLTDDRSGLWDHRDPAWSPDGKEICYSSRHGLWIVPISGGPTRRLTLDDERDFEPAWGYQGRYIYFSSYRGGTLAIWRVNPRGGQPERVTPGTGPESHPSLPWDGKRLVHTTGTENQECVLLDRKSGKESIVAASESDYMTSIARDGTKIVYASMRGGAGSHNLWLQPLDGGYARGAAQQLTHFTDIASLPTLSPDGKWIAFYRIIVGQRDIWTVSSLGGEPIQFTTHEAADMHPAWSPDGSQLAFASERAGGCDIWAAPVKEGRRSGPERQVTTGPFLAYMPAWSPDGSSIAFRGVAGDRYEVWTIASKGGMPARKLTDGADVVQVRWDPFSGDILASATWESDRVKLWRVSAQTGSPQPFSPLVDFGAKTAHVGLFDLSGDGQSLIFARSRGAKSQIWTLEAQNGLY